MKCQLCRSEPCACGQVPFLSARDTGQIWRARGEPSRGVVTFPCWIFTPGFGVARALRWENVNGLWTHWMPLIDGDIPNPPGAVELRTGMNQMPIHAAEVQATAYSPLRINLLLHCAVSPIDAEVPNFEASGVQSELQDLLTAGAIVQRDSRCFQATPLGRAWVAALCNVPIPRVAYIDSHGQELEVR